MYEYRKTIYVMLFATLVIIDQLSKHIIRSSGGFYICNQNSAFGINIPVILFWVFWFLITSILFVELYKRYTAMTSFSGNCSVMPLVFILSGAISNILDRLARGCVIDFIDLHFWPVFNLADIYITIGSIMFVYKILNRK